MRNLPTLLIPAALVAPLSCAEDTVAPEPPEIPDPPELPGEPASLVLSADTVRPAAIGAAVSDTNGIALGDAAADTLGQRQAVSLATMAADSNGVAVPGRTVVWTTSDPAAATVDAAGGVTDEGWGADATITATVDGVSGTAAVHLLDQLALTTDRDGNRQVYVMNADGTGAVNLSDDPAAIDHAAAWRPRP